MNKTVSAAAVFVFLGIVANAAAQAEAPVKGASQGQAVLDRYCITCHNEKLKTAGLMLDKLDFAHPGPNAETWEKVVRKVRAGMMPPGGAPRPDRATMDAF